MSETALQGAIARKHLDLDKDETGPVERVDPVSTRSSGRAASRTGTAKGRGRPGSPPTPGLAAGGPPYTRSRDHPGPAGGPRSPSANPARRTYSHAPAVVRRPSRSFIAFNLR